MKKRIIAMLLCAATISAGAMKKPTGPVAAAR